MAKFTQKILSAGDDKKYEQAKELVKVCDKTAKKWWEALTAIEDNKWYLAEFPTFREWCQKYVPWAPGTIRMARFKARQASSRTLIAETTNEPIIESEISNNENKGVTKKLRPDTAVSNHNINSSSAKKEVVLDDMKVPIPEPCLEFWNRRQEIQDLMTQVSRIKCLIEEKKKQGDKLFMKISQHGLESADKLYGYLSIAKPQTVCGTCKGWLETKGGICSACGSTGLQSLDEYKRLTPIEEQSIRIKAHESKRLPAGVS